VVMLVAFAVSAATGIFFGILARATGGEPQAGRGAALRVTRHGRSRGPACIRPANPVTSWSRGTAIPTCRSRREPRHGAPRARGNSRARAISPRQASAVTVAKYAYSPPRSWRSTQFVDAVDFAPRNSSRIALPCEAISAASRIATASIKSASAARRQAAPIRARRVSTTPHLHGDPPDSGGD